MKKISIILTLTIAGMSSCQEAESGPKAEQEKKEQSDFQWETEQFADLRILRYQVPGWNKLSLQKKKLAYFLNEAGLAGRDIIYDQLYRHNLEIRRALEDIVKNYEGKKDAKWEKFMTYAKRVWFSNGIHHHYSHAKIKPQFDSQYLTELLEATDAQLSKEAQAVIFNDVDAKGVSKDPDKDLLLASAVNFYDPGITEDEASAFYADRKDAAESEPVSHGLNSKLIKKDGELQEAVWHIDGMYGPAIAKIVHWLEKAVEVAENPKQAKALKLLIEYYKTGDLKTWDAYNIAWLQDTESDVDYINSFIEVYHDPLGYKGTFESVVQVRDMEASEKMAVISENIQYFEDNSPIMDAHKKPEVKGVSYRMINVVGEAGATTPATPIGVNLPNSNWIRTEHGSKSISLANIEHAYEMAKAGGFLEEFTFTTEERERAEEYAGTASKLHTALHEVVGHASGQQEPGVRSSTEVLKNYYSTLEEARADLVALYFIMDPKLRELGLIDSDEVGKAEYDNYIRNGLMLQLRRLEVGESIEEDHMRNRQLVAAWAYEMGRNDGVIEKKQIKGKTFFVIQDYDGLRDIFARQLREIQRIKSQGDYDEGRRLVETYGVEVDSTLHREVLKRTEKLNIAPYSGFIQPIMEPQMKGDSISDIELRFPRDFTEQMIYYGDNYSFLP